MELYTSKHTKILKDTVNLEIFTRILFSRIALRDICYVEILQLGHDSPIISKRQSDFSYFRAYAKFCKNKTHPKISGFTVHVYN